MKAFHDVCADGDKGKKTGIATVQEYEIRQKPLLLQLSCGRMKKHCNGPVQ